MEKIKDIKVEEFTYTAPTMEAFTTVRSLCNWDLHFSIPGTVNADKIIKSTGTIDLLNREIKLLCDNNNVFFVGLGKGDHARVYVEDDNMRVYVGFDSKDGSRKQNILTPEKCQALFDCKTQKAFESKVKEEIITEHEFDYIMRYVRKSKENDFSKISFLEEYTGKKYKES